LCTVLQNQRELSRRHRESDHDRPDLIDRHQRRRAIAVHQISDTHKETSGLARNRRTNRGVFEVELGVRNRSAIRTHGGIR
jgi:hypothetical protein